MKTQPASFPRNQAEGNATSHGLCRVSRCGHLQEVHIFMSAIAHGAVGPKYRGYFAFALTCGRLAEGPRRSLLVDWDSAETR